ncbi:uncharacterized protein LOC130451003 [Diorhabda sublineata]|uniref:uncharacterized protein LOC130451003 n=1 Tax=Diorhabda sublineata TaxID=1163346 RepID=UPI0024E15288|nr:uncharacterized protein LOC130451003 [Diorhabda sublineata]
MKQPTSKQTSQKTSTKISVVDRDLQRKRVIEATIQKHKVFLMKYVAPSNRHVFEVIFDDWIKIPPWIGPTVQEKNLAKQKKAKKASNKKKTRSIGTGITVIHKAIGTKDFETENVKGSNNNQNIPSSNKNVPHSSIMYKQKYPQ